MLDVSGVIEPSVGRSVEVGPIALHEDHLTGLRLALLEDSVLELDDGALHDDGPAVVLHELIVVFHGHLS